MPFSHLDRVPALAVSFLLTFVCTLPAISGAADSGAAKNEEALGWSWSGVFRMRGEYLENSFRLLAPQRDQIGTTRLELALRYKSDDWEGMAEIQDSRAWSAESRSPIGTDDVNAAEPIQLWLGRRWELPTGSLEARAGRMTMNFGSRRLLARNRFRNTSNAFQGALLAWEQVDMRLQAFYTLPLQREPTDFQRAALRDNEAALDRAGTAERFAGVTMAWRASPEIDLETYLFQNRRRPRIGRPLPTQDLWTAGFRFRQRHGDWRIEWESALQVGDSGQLLPISDTPELSHRAWFLSAGLSRELLPGLELGLVYDHATGDRDPFDSRNERFDRLYGARASELGPSGIFGAAIRSNQRSTALRLRWQREPHHHVLFSLRQLALDAPRDAFVTGGRRDVTGESGRDLGLQWELRYRWSAMTGRINWESGVALLAAGNYFDGSGAQLNPALGASSTRYAFTQLSFRF